MLALIAYSTTKGDPRWYDLVANNILNHGVVSDDTAPPFVPTLYRPPLYMAFMALVRLVAGQSVLVLQLVQCLIGVTGVAILASAVATFSKRHGRWALWALALTPFDAVYCGAMLSETLVTFFLISGISAPLLLRGWWRWPLSGVLLGLAALTRDVYMLMIPCFAVTASLVALRGQPITRRLVVVAAVTLGGVMTIAPWTARNYSVAHAIVPISRSSFAHSLYLGTWVRDLSHMAPGAEVGEPADFPAFAWKLPGEYELYEKWSWHKPNDPAERDRVYMGMFKRRVAADPGGVALAWIRRSTIVWMNTSRFDLFPFRPALLARGAPLYYVAKVLLFGINVAGVILGMAGVVLCIWKRERRLLWFALPVLYTLAVLTPLGVVEPRYTQPIYSFLLVMACLTARHAVVLWRRRARRSLRSARVQPV